MSYISLAAGNVVAYADMDLEIGNTMTHSSYWSGVSDYYFNCVAGNYQVTIACRCAVYIDVHSNDRWEMTFFVRNLGDKRYLVSGFANALTQGTADGIVGRPREWAFRAGYRF